MKNYVKKKFRPIRKIISTLRRVIFLKTDDFTIISNNCWAGNVYQRYNLEYKTPTIGMYFMADEYVKFLKNIKYYINTNIVFIEIEKSKYKKKLIEENYKGLIGVLDDIEIMFLHYGNICEATEKWNRRCKRINWSKLIVKFNDQNGCNYKHIKIFNELKYKNKICFTAKKYPEINCNIFMSEYKDFDYVKNDIKKYKKYLNITEYLNKLTNSL